MVDSMYLCTYIPTVVLYQRGNCRGSKTGLLQ